MGDAGSIRGAQNCHAGLGHRDIEQSVVSGVVKHGPAVAIGKGFRSALHRLMMSCDASSTWTYYSTLSSSMS